MSSRQSSRIPTTTIALVVVVAVFGIENVTDDYQEMYHAVIAKLGDHLDDAGAWKRIPPKEIDAKDAPCKQVKLTSDPIDIESFAWLKNNPADAGRYINMGSVFIQDPEIGANVGTYRCQVKGPRKIGVWADDEFAKGIKPRIHKSALNRLEARVDGYGPDNLLDLQGAFEVEERD